MIYLMETLTPNRPTSKKLDAFIQFATDELIPFYNDCHGSLKAAWISNDRMLFQVTQLVSFNSIQDYLDFSIHLESNKQIGETLYRFMPKRRHELYRAASQKFVEILDNVIEKGIVDTPGTCTIATLEVEPAELSGFTLMQERGVDMGLPLVGFLRSITGRRDRIVDIWKAELQSGGYRPLQYYESIGMNDEWWETIRRIGPKEKMISAGLLPYSPLK